MSNHILEFYVDAIYFPSPNRYAGLAIICW